MFTGADTIYRYHTRIELLDQGSPNLGAIKVMYSPATWIDCPSKCETEFHVFTLNGRLVVKGIIKNLEQRVTGYEAVSLHQSNHSGRAPIY